MKQTTLRKEIRCSGVGLHSGQRVAITLKPAVADTGIVFSLLTKDGRHVLTPSPTKVIDTGLATTLGSSVGKVSTVEHLLATLVGLEVDNVIVEVDGDEIPILDGSASVYVYLINSAGVTVLDRARCVAKIRRPVFFEREGKRIHATPSECLEIDYQISFEHPLIRQQHFHFTSTPKAFATQIARARTFGFAKDVEYLQKNGFARGGSLENAVVFDEYGVVNPDGLRFADEMVRHKILDFMGDIAVGSHRLIGHFDVFCSGHEFNNQFMRYLFENAADHLEFMPLSGGPKGGRPYAKQASLPSNVPAWA